MDLLFDLRDRHGATLVLVTHAPELAARCDRVVRLRDGGARSPRRTRRRPNEPAACRPHRARELRGGLAGFRDVPGLPGAGRRRHRRRRHACARRSRRAGARGRRPSGRRCGDGVHLSLRRRRTNAPGWTRAPTRCRRSSISARWPWCATGDASGRGLTQVKAVDAAYPLWRGRADAGHAAGRGAGRRRTGCRARDGRGADRPAGPCAGRPVPAGHAGLPADRARLCANPTAPRRGFGLGPRTIVRSARRWPESRLLAAGHAVRDRLPPASAAGGRSGRAASREAAALFRERACAGATRATARRACSGFVDRLGAVSGAGRACRAGRGRRRRFGRGARLSGRARPRPSPR